MVLGCLQSCPLLNEVGVMHSDLQLSDTQNALNSAENVSIMLFSSLEPLLVNKLKVLIVDYFSFSSSAAEALSHSLQSQHCSLVTLQFFYCSFLTDAFKQLAIAIGRNTSLHYIIFHACQPNSDVKILADSLRVNQTLEMVKIWQLGTPSLTDKVAFQALKECNQNIFFDVHYIY